MKNLIVIIVLICNIAVYGQVHEGLEIREYPWRMHAFNYPRTPDGDSVVVAKYNEIWYFNVDSLCYYMVTDRRSIYTEDLAHYYYYQVLDYASEKQVEEGYRKIKAAAKKYNSTLLNDEADYMRIHAQFYSKLFSGGGVTEEEVESAVRQMHEYIRRFVYRDDKLRHLEYLAEPYTIYRDFGNYAKMFRYIPPIVDLLNEVNLTDYPDYYHFYLYIGSDYYNFRDYERAVFFLKKALHDAPPRFSDRSGLQARFVLASYYAEINQLDSSDYYYRSLYDNTDTVRFRPCYDVRAAVGIAKNLIRRGMHTEAMPILKRWLPEAMKEWLRNEIFDIYIAMGECYLAEKQPERAKEMIDSINILMGQYQNAYFRKEKLFELLFHYYLDTGQTTLAYHYIDSMRLAHDEHEERTSSLIILRSEQEVHEAEIALKNEQEQKRKTQLQVAVIVIILIVLALIIYAYLYRQKQKAYKGLFQQIKKQDKLADELKQITTAAAEEETTAAAEEATTTAAEAEATTEAVATATATTEEAVEEERQQNDMRQHRLVELMRVYIINNKRKSFTDIYRDELSVILSTNRTTLSEAVKNVTGKTLMEYAHFLKLEEARKILDKHHELSIEAIAEECGLSTRTFYRLFKEYYKMSPTEYRKMAKKN